MIRSATVGRMPRSCWTYMPSAVIDGVGARRGRYAYRPGSLGSVTERSHFCAPRSAVSGTAIPARRALTSDITCHPSTDVSPS